mmetsp:Transcript_28299/g.51581  ORF Transcript_28299/g.51581 Transcript_28299/m.51581 type:complete len:82 (+) Transcript_28299:121-366(+)
MGAKDATDTSTGTAEDTIKVSGIMGDTADTATTEEVAVGTMGRAADHVMDTIMATTRREQTYLNLNLNVTVRRRGRNPRRP